MILSLPTQGKSWRIRVGIQSDRAVDLMVRGRDVDNVYSNYFVRKVPIHSSLMEETDGYREFSLLLPLSPHRLLLDIHPMDYAQDAILRLEKFEVEPLDAPPLLALPQVHRFIRFAERFAQDAGWSPNGTYQSGSGEFKIEYLLQITDILGKVQATPARTHRVTGDIQVSSASFRLYTIPMRVFILLHEWMHFQYNTRSEKEADLRALAHYLDLYYPELEAIYSGTKVMNAQTPAARKNKRDRVRDIFHFTNQCRIEQVQGGACTTL